MDKISSFTRESNSVLSENKYLLQKLQELNNKIKIKNTQLYNIETRLENLDIFEQHMTSLNLRCEFLDNQISNLENKHLNVYNNRSTQSIPRPTDFNSKIEWRTTETTLDNLSTEFNYLREQLEIANNQITTDPSFNDDSTISTNTDNTTNSIFSDAEHYSTDDACTVSSFSGMRDRVNENSITKTEISNNGKKVLLKMESFLNFNEKISPHKPLTRHGIGPLKGFKINAIHENPLKENEGQAFSHPIQKKASKKSMNKQLELIELPSINEEYISTESFSEYNRTTRGLNSQPKHDNVNYYKDHDHSFIYNQKQHKRYSSLPENPINSDSIDTSNEDPLRHFTSHDTGLSTKFTSNHITDLLFNHEELSNFTADQNFESSSFSVSNVTNNAQPFTMYSDYETEHEFTNIVYDSDESYGDENVTPLVLKKDSKMNLYRCKSHESTFSINTKATKYYPLREKNLDLKAQTMKWLKPTVPIVSSSIQPYTATKNTSISKSKSNAHDDIINILHSGVNNKENAELTEPSTPIIIPTTPSRISINSSWVPTKIFASPMPIAKSANDKSTSDDGEIKSSWISSFIPNSAFTNPEIGKLMNKNPSNDQTFPKTRKISKNLLNERTHNFNGPSSTLTIKNNGNRIIKHGYGSSFNENVLSSRVSHTALRDALQYDIV